MNFRAPLSFVLSAVLSIGNCSYAEEVDAKAKSFVNAYVDFCLKNLPNRLEALRAYLITTAFPKLPPLEVSRFGEQGDLWPVATQEHQGNLALSLEPGKNVCVLYGRRAKQQDVERLFVQAVGQTRPPVISERQEDKWSDAPANAKTHTISYIWSLPNPAATKKFLFVLTTTDSENVHVQASATASTISVAE